MTQLLPPKKEVALALLERSNVDVYLDPRAKGVVVPPQFRKEPRLILKIGLNMPVPIPDLRLDEESMSCTLSFNRSPFYCVVPWSSVFAMVGEDGRGMVWPDDVPQELAVKVVEPGDPVDARAGPSRSLSEVAAPSSASSAAARRGGGARGAAARTPVTGDDAAAERPPSSRAAAGAGNGKGGKKKKKDEGRPVLVAVPSEPSTGSSGTDSSRSPRSPGAPAPLREAQRERLGDAPPPRDGVSAIPSRPRQPSPAQRRPDGTIARPKRELPPYLRVVK
jgi:stringent starvation protein B